VPLPTNDDINKGIGKAASYGIGLLNKANTALDSGRAARIKAFADQDAAETAAKEAAQQEYWRKRGEDVPPVKLARGTACLQGKKGVDKIDAKLTRGEAVLPVKTVKALGARNIAATIKATNDGKKPAFGARQGGKYADGIVPKSKTFGENIEILAKKLPSIETPPNLQAIGVGPSAPQVIRTEGGVGHGPRAPAVPAVVPTPATAAPPVATVAAAPAAPTVPAPPVAPALTYNQQGLPGGATDTRAMMGADVRTAPARGVYGDVRGGKTIVTATRTPMTTPEGGITWGAEPPKFPGSAATQNPQTDMQPLNVAQAAGYGEGGTGFGVKNAFSAQDVTDINERIRNRVARGGANTFEAIGRTLTPEQKAYEDERFAQGTELANKLKGEAAAITAKEEAEKAARVPDFTQFPQTWEGLIARRRAMQQYGAGQKAAEVAQAGTARQAQLGVQQAQLGVQQRAADINEQNVQSRMREREYGVEQTKKLDEVRAELAQLPPNAPKRAALMQQLQDLSGTYAKPEMEQITEKTTPLGVETERKYSQRLGAGAQVAPQRPVGTKSTVGGKTAVWDGAKWVPQ